AGAAFARTAGAAFAHFLELLLLVFGQDLLELGVHFLLKRFHLLLLLVAELQRLLEEHRQDLARLRAPARTAITRTPVTRATIAGAAGAIARTAVAGRTIARPPITGATVARAAGTRVREFLGREGDDVFLRDRALL